MIRNVEIRNFKGIKNLKFDVQEIIVFFGINNSGKSTILQAMSAWSEIASEWVMRMQDVETKDIDLARDKSNNYPTVNLINEQLSSVTLNGFDHLWYERIVEELVVIKITHEKWEIGFELIFEASELIKARPTKDTTEQDIKNYAKDSIKLVCISPFSGIYFPESLLDRSAVPVRVSRGQVGQVLRNVILRVSQDPTKWEILHDRMKRYYYCDLLTPSPSEPILVYFRELSRKVQYELNSAGSGFLQLLAIYATTLFLDSTVILIDEPDAHLHPRRQQDVLPDFRDTFPGSQLFFCTHSPQLLTTVKPNQILGVKNSGEGIFLDKVPLSVPSYGAESGDVLATIMGVNQRPRDNEFSRKLLKYVELVGQDQGESQDAKLLRKELDTISPRDSALDKADIEIRRRKLMKDWNQNQ